MKHKTGRKLRGPDTVMCTVRGTLLQMEPAKGRPGCVLVMGNGTTTGRYYVPLAPHECRTQFPEGTVVSFRMYPGTLPGEDGTYDTAGPADRFWEVSAS